MDLFIILTRIYHAFGPDVDLEVPESDFPNIDRFDSDLEAWKSAWLPRLGMYGQSYQGQASFLMVCLQLDANMLDITHITLFSCITISLGCS